MDSKNNKQSKNFLFVYPLKLSECSSIEILSAVLKKAGHNTSLILHHNQEKYFENRLKKRIEEFKPDFIGFSVMTTDYAWALKTANLVRKFTAAPIVFGGIQVTSCPEEVISHDCVDFIVVGEGEGAILELIENPKKQNIKNVWLKKDKRIIKNPLRPLIQNLDSIPFLDKQLFLREAPHFKELYVCMTGRGCPFSCTYCFNCFMRNLYPGEKWVRKRSVQNVIEELKLAKQKINPKTILFIDDCFTSHKEWLLEFLKIYQKEINLPFKVLTHPNFVNDEMLSALKKSKCVSIELGVQTPSERVRKDICKRNESNELVKEVVQKIKNHKMFVLTDHIFQLPSTTFEEYEKGLEFYIDIKPSKITQFWLQYYPNTEIVEIGKKYGEYTDKELKETIKGNIVWDEHNQRKIKANPELAYIARFICWIPILPRSASRYLLRKRLYRKIFFTDNLNVVPYILKYLSSFSTIPVTLRALKRTIIMKRYLTQLNKEGEMNSEYKN
ncbi:MAG: radical SAM protein [Candidatus Pacearchaeota archaeon]